jgi:hypothetical protein
LQSKWNGTYAEEQEVESAEVVGVGVRVTEAVVVGIGFVEDAGTCDLWLGMSVELQQVCENKP